MDERLAGYARAQFQQLKQYVVPQDPCEQLKGHWGTAPRAKDAEWATTAHPLWKAARRALANGNHALPVRRGWQAAATAMPMGPTALRTTTQLMVVHPAWSML